MIKTREKLLSLTLYLFSFSPNVSVNIEQKKSGKTKKGKKNKRFPARILRIS
jgi:hypothetical protein